MIANNCMEKSEKIDEKEIIAKKLVMLFQDDFILKLHVDRFYNMIIKNWIKKKNSSFRKYLQVFKFLRKNWDNNSSI